MAKSKIVLTMTEHEFCRIVDLADTISAMIGVGSDFDEEARKNVKAFDRMLKRNGYRRTKS